MKKGYYVALALLIAAFGCRAEITEAQIDTDCAQIASYARKGERYYQKKNYPKARAAFEEQVAWLEQCELLKDKSNDAQLATAYNNVALTWIHQGEYRKALAWLQIMPDDEKSRYNMARIEKKLASLPAPTSPAGEYWQYAGRGSWQVFTLKPQKGERFLAEWSGYYFGLMAMYYGPNLGEFSQPVTFKEGKGDIILHDEGIAECTISLTLAADLQSLVAETDEPMNCGFGHNVSADGKYLRVS